MADPTRLRDERFDPGGSTVVAKGAKPIPFRKPEVPMKRVSFYIPEPLFEDLQEFARERGESVTGVLRWSLGIGKAIWDEIKTGQKIRSDAPDGGNRKEMVFGR